MSEIELANKKLNNIRKLSYLWVAGGNALPILLALIFLRNTLLAFDVVALTILLATYILTFLLTLSIPQRLLAYLGWGTSLAVISYQTIKLANLLFISQTNAGLDLAKYTPWLAFTYLQCYLLLGIRGGRLSTTLFFSANLITSICYLSIITPPDVFIVELLITINLVGLLCWVMFYILAFVLKNHAEAFSTVRTIATLAEKDTVTGLSTRLAFEKRLRSFLATSSSKFAALLFLDLDGFKNVNDTLGHSVGDQLLKQVAERVKKQVREEDIVARIGGDEFTIALLGCEITKAEQIAKALCQELDNSFNIEGNWVSISVSIGICAIPYHGSNVSSLLNKADIAMYHAKKSGKNKVVTFNEKVKDAVLEHNSMTQKLTQALKNNEFHLNYQPIIDLRTQTIARFEVLLRWVNNDNTNIPPERFIPYCEQSGLIVPLGKWIFEETCKQISKWHQQGFKGLKVAINISPIQLLKANFTQFVEQALKKYKLSASQIELEVTENSLVSSEAIKSLQKLQQLGISIAIDDFGMGYSSLARLKKLPIDIIKIDKYFISDLNITYNDELIQTIINLAKTLGKAIVAEGIEDILQANKLQSMGCEFAQGYYFAKPLLASAATDLLSKHSTAPQTYSYAS